MKFILQEFSHSLTFKVSCEFKLEKNTFEIFYEVEGKVSDLGTPSSSTKLKQAHDLWKKTCFECFFFQKNSEQYAELNFNPMKEWDFIFFDSYRKVSSEKLSFSLLGIDAGFSEKKLQVSCAIEIPQHSSFLASPSAILMPPKEKCLYFALAHSEKPDFHKRQTIESKGFQLLS